MTKLNEMTAQELLLVLKATKETNKPLLKAVFREILKNHTDMQFIEGLSIPFLAMANSVIPEIVKAERRSKDAVEILTGQQKTFKSYEECVPLMPYLVRKTKSDEVIGMVRLRKGKKINKDVTEYPVYDYIPFFDKDKAEEVQLAKFNDEKMQMFSVVYRSWEAWGEPDTDEEYVKEEELRKAVIHMAQNGVGINIQHDKGQMVSKSDALIIEQYQARTSWSEGDLEVRKGDLVATTQFFKTNVGESLWNKLKSGDFTTYSFEGRAQVEA